MQPMVTPATSAFNTFSTMTSTGPVVPSVPVRIGAASVIVASVTDLPAPLKRSRDLQWGPAAVALPILP